MSKLSTQSASIGLASTAGKAPLPVMRPRLPSFAQIERYLREIDETRWYSNFGPLNQRFESRLAEHVGAPEEGVITAANATLGITAALLATEPRGGAFCMMPAWTFVATAHAALAAGLIPWFVDVDPDSWMLTPDLATMALRTPPGAVGAIIAVGPFGAHVDGIEWDRFSAETGIPVVIDGAACFDGCVAVRSPTVVSLHATKACGIGEGGFVASSDTSRSRKIRRALNFGFYGSRIAHRPAVNAKLSEYSAAVGLAALDVWPETRDGFARVARRYYEGLRGTRVRLMAGYSRDWISSTCIIFSAQTPPSRLIQRLAEAKIDYRRWWGSGVHSHPAFSQFPRTGLDVTEDLGQSYLGLPCFPDLADGDIDFICETVKNTAC